MNNVCVFHSDSGAKKKLFFFSLHSFVSTPKCFFVCISLNIRRSERLPLLWRLTLGTWFISIKCFLFSGKCSADATALHFTVAVFCTYTSPVPCSLEALAASILRWFCLWLGLLVLDPFTHQLGTAPWTVTAWGGSKYYPTVALILIALKSCTLEMQIRTLTKRSHSYSPSLLKSEVTPLICSWAHLRLSHCPLQSHPTQLIRRR